MKMRAHDFGFASKEYRQVVESKACYITYRPGHVTCSQNPFREI